MNVNKWGPGGWVFLHTITFNYPLKPTLADKENYRNFFKSVGNILPCKYCRDSYQVYYSFLPIDQFLDSREGVTFWLYKIHDLINKKIYKVSTSFEDVIRKYEDIRAKCGNMSRDGDKDKKYKTCQAPMEIDQEYLHNFQKKACTYDPLMKDLIKKLYASDINPNKDVKNENYRINYTKIQNNNIS